MVDNITRADVAGIIQDAYSDTFLRVVPKKSAVMSVFPTVNMGTKINSLPVLATTPHAKWIGETAGGDGVKPTSKALWENKRLVAEEIAVIIPVHENVLADATSDVLGQIAVLGANALALGFDAAVLFGINKPASWTSPDLFKSATDGGNLFQVGTGENDIAGSILKAAEDLDDDGYDADTLLTRRGLRYRLANIRDTTGAPIFVSSLNQITGNESNSFAGLNTAFASGTVLGDIPVWDRTKAEALVADSTRVACGIRQDVTVKFLDQATLGTGSSQINLAENDMVALRFVGRYAYVLADLVAEKSVRTVKSPVAAVTPKAAA